MKSKSTVSKVLALTATAVLAAGFSLVASAVAPTAAQAAQSISVSPAGPYKGGEKVTVTASGFSPNAPVAVGQCAVGRAVTGPGDCGASKIGASRLLQANAQGVATGQLTIIVGSIQNSKAPVEKCGPSNPCFISATNITNAKETTGSDGKLTSKVFEVKYVGASTTKKTTTKATTKTETSTSNATTTKTTKAAALPKTGPKETAILALFGLALFQIGLIFAVRATRATPRRARL